jgi:hypothetical protein
MAVVVTPMRQGTKSRKKMYFRILMHIGAILRANDERIKLDSSNFDQNQR